MTTNATLLSRSAIRATASLVRYYYYGIRPAETD